MTEEFTSIVQGGGLRGLWRGAGPTVQRATLLTASQAIRTPEALHGQQLASLMHLFRYPAMTMPSTLFSI